MVRVTRSMVAKGLAPKPTEILPYETRPSSKKGAIAKTRTKKPAKKPTKAPLQTPSKVTKQRLIHSESPVHSTPKTSVKRLAKSVTASPIVSSPKSAKQSPTSLRNRVENSKAAQSPTVPAPTLSKVEDETRPDEVSVDQQKLEDEGIFDDEKGTLLWDLICSKKSRVRISNVVFYRRSSAENGVLVIIICFRLVAHLLCINVSLLCSPCTCFVLPIFRP